MTQRKATLNVMTYDDIKTSYALISAIENDKMYLRVASYDIFDGAESILVKVTGKSDKKIYSLKGLEENPSGDSVFKILSEENISDEESYHKLDYKGEFKVALFKDEEKQKYLGYQERINAKERGGLRSRIRELLSKGDEDNSELLALMLDMNTKLDEILSLLRPDIEIDGAFNVRGIDLSGEGITFFSERDLRGAKNIFITGLLADSAKRFNFACICALKSVKSNYDRSGIFHASFLNIDEEMRDEFVRFVFAREREQLKDIKK